MLTLSRIGVDNSFIRPNGMMVRAFDGTKTSGCREIDLKVLIGPCEFEIPFVVIDIPAVFNLLLGHPWIHTAGAIPTSLHQKVKLITGDKVITVMAEEDISVPITALVPFIDTQQLDSTSKYYSFEFVFVKYILEGGSISYE